MMDRAQIISKPSVPLGTSASVAVSAYVAFYAFKTLGAVPQEYFFLGVGFGSLLTGVVLYFIITEFAEVSRRGD